MTAAEVRKPPIEAVPVPEAASPHRLERMDHIAMTLPDLVEAEKWYVGVLGAKVVARHGWGGDKTPTRPHVDLEVGNNVFSMFLGEPAPFSGRLNHYAFYCNSLDELDAWREHLKRSNVEMKPPVVHTGFSNLSVYFHDPWGHRLEIFTWLEDQPTALSEAEARGGGEFEPPQHLTVR